MAKNVVTHFKIDPSAKNFFEVSARPSGIVNWALSKMKAVPEHTLIASRDCLDYKAGSVFGYESVSAPIHKVSKILSGIRRNIFLLVVACFFLLMGLYSGFSNLIAGTLF